MQACWWSVCFTCKHWPGPTTRIMLSPALGRTQQHLSPMWIFKRLLICIYISADVSAQLTACSSPHLSWWYLLLQMYCYWGHGIEWFQPGEWAGAVSVICYIDQILLLFVEQVMPSQPGLGLGLEQVLLLLINTEWHCNFCTGWNTGWVLLPYNCKSRTVNKKKRANETLRPIASWSHDTQTQCLAVWRRIPAIWEWTSLWEWDWR